MPLPRPFQPKPIPRQDRTIHHRHRSSRQQYLSRAGLEDVPFQVNPRHDANQLQALGGELESPHIGHVEHLLAQAQRLFGAEGDVVRLPDELGLAGFGLSSVVNMVGERVMPEQSLLKRTFWSTLLLCLASALPLVGWFLLLPYLLAIGIGGVILGFFQKDS